MDEVINLYKEQGETPLARLRRHLRHGAHPEARYTYLGRLDPMAEGVLLVAPGTIDKGKRHMLLALPKEYECTVLCGVSTDSYDLLGCVARAVDRATQIHVPLLRGLAAVNAMVGTFEQRYPVFSSKPVAGKPLFVWARDNANVSLPTHTVTVYDSVLVKMSKENGRTLLSDIESRIERVVGDFRQATIISLWQRTLGPLYDMSFDLMTFRVRVSSGTYVRALAHDMGEKLGCPTCAFSIIRTRVGDYAIENALRE